MSSDRVFLVGFMCSGKSTVGKLLSAELRWEFLDVDREIEKEEGMSIPEIFEKKGEPYFRKRELEKLIELSSKSNVIISTGGGLGADEKAMEFMKGKGVVVWLKVDFDTFLQRCGKDPSRPLLKKDKSELLSLFMERSKTYQKSHIVLDAYGSPEVLLKELIAKLSLNEL
ncbi:MAG: shikimate kinase [Aquificaceae bacterium]|nr:shikimate kinase [Aquificaceae bacterium]